MQDEYDLIIDALHAIRQIRSVHGSGTVSVGKCDEIAEMLRLRAKSLPPISEAQPVIRNSLALAIVDAISNNYGTKRHS
jgi:DNA-directed RNA polymerase subunit H (RpoH/RPB5)